MKEAYVTPTFEIKEYESETIVTASGNVWNDEDGWSGIYRP